MISFWELPHLVAHTANGWLDDGRAYENANDVDRQRQRRQCVSRQRAHRETTDRAREGNSCTAGVDTSTQTHDNSEASVRPRAARRAYRIHQPRPCPAHVGTLAAQNGPSRMRSSTWPSPATSSTSSTSCPIGDSPLRGACRISFGGRRHSARRQRRRRPSVRPCSLLQPSILIVMRGILARAEKRLERIYG